MSRAASEQDPARLLLELEDGRREFVFPTVEVVANTASQVVVRFANERGETVRATLPKALLRQVVSLKMLW